MGAIRPPKPEDFPAIYDNFFGRMALALDNCIEAHPVGVMASLLSYGSAAIGGRHQITTIKGSLSLHIWTVLSGISGGGGKGDATKVAREVFDKALPNWGALHSKPGFDTGLGIISYLNDNREDTGMPRDLLIFEAELSNTISQMSSDQRMITTWTKLFDRDTLMYATGKDRMEIPNPYVTILAHVQPDLFVKTKTSKATAVGAWNRCLFIHVDQSKTLDLFGDISEKNRLVRILGRQFYDAYVWINEREMNDVIVPRHVSKEFARRIRPKVLALTRQSRDIIKYCQRGDAYLLKLAALYALFDKRDHLKIEDFDSAMALIEYSIASVKYTLSNESEFSGMTVLATRIKDFAEKYGPATYTKMRTHVGGHYTKDAYISAFIELRGKVDVYTLPNSGKPGPKGTWYIATPKQRPEGAVLVDLGDDYETPVDEPQDHPKYQTPPQEDEEVVVEAEVVKDEPEAATRAPERAPEPVKALPAPKTPKTPRKPVNGASRASQAHTQARPRKAAPKTAEPATSKTSRSRWW